MNVFRTLVRASKAPFTLSHQSCLLHIGSCFSEHIGRRFAENKFNVVINPFGQQYNPLSIAQGLRDLIDGKTYTANDLFFYRERYHSFDHHSQFSGSDAAQVLAQINQQLQIASQQLRKAEVLFLTFGTAHVFVHRESDRIVSNCHQLPAGHFERRLSGIAEMQAALSGVLEQLKSINPNIQLVLTVSPVRYLGLGAYENSLTKGSLFVLIEELKKEFPGLWYFPSYEMVIDDLRDYRFFSEDMQHPNATAIDYVWQNLSAALFHKETCMLLGEIEDIRRAVQHRPRHPRGDSHREFVRAHLDKIEHLEKQFNLDFSAEKRQLQQSGS